MLDSIFEVIAGYIFTTYGWLCGVVMIVLSILGRIVLKNYKTWFKKVPYFGKTVIEIDEDVEEYISQSQPFFNDRYRILKIEIPNLELTVDQPVRDRLFKDLLTLSFTLIYETADKIVNDPGLADWSAQEWMERISQFVNSLLRKTEERAHKAQIPDIVIKKYLRWQVESVESLNEYILLLGNSKLYSTSIAKTNTLLLIMNLMLECTLGDADQELSSINGELTGLNYKGLILE